MLMHEITGPILNGIYGLLNSGNYPHCNNGRPYVEFSGEVWLGLLTRMPKADKSAYEDDTYFAELSDPNYRRFRLDAVSRINKKYIMADAVDGEVELVGEDRCLPAVIRNQAPLIFPENMVPETIVGWGLFRSADTSDKVTLPFAWGVVGPTEEGEPIELEAEESPIIRDGGLTFIFK